MLQSSGGTFFSFNLSCNVTKSTGLPSLFNSSIVSNKNENSDDIILGFNFIKYFNYSLFDYDNKKVYLYSDNSRGEYFESWTECLQETARLLREQYLNQNGKYYVGSSIWNVNVHYSTSEHWADEIISIVNDYSNKLK